MGIAELSVAFAGFSGLIGVVSANPDVAAPSYWFRLWVMIEFSITTMMLAMLPFVAHYFGFEGERLWMLGSASIAGFLIVHIVIASPKVRRLYRTGQWLSPPAILDYSVPALMAVCLVTQSLNVAGIVLERTFAGFLLGLILLLAISCVNFVCLMWSRLVRSFDLR